MEKVYVMQITTGHDDVHNNVINYTEEDAIKDNIFIGDNVIFKAWNNELIHKIECSLEDCSTLVSRFSKIDSFSVDVLCDVFDDIVERKIVEDNYSELMSLIHSYTETCKGCFSYFDCIAKVLSLFHKTKFVAGTIYDVEYSCETFYICPQDKEKLVKTVIAKDYFNSKPMYKITKFDSDELENDTIEYLENKIFNDDESSVYTRCDSIMSSREKKELFLNYVFHYGNHNLTYKDVVLLEIDFTYVITKFCYRKE